MKRIFLLSLILVLYSRIFTQNYIWPTDASNLLSSTFGEFREGRFHTGIDIKTWGRTGYKVFAADSGYVWKITVSPFGYGRAIYLKLHDGRIAVYAHLERFADKLENIAKKEQIEQKSFRIVKYFKENSIRVKKGEFIAYTGKSGSGPPHLHFELRDSEAIPVNPLNFNFDFIDLKPPIAEKICFYPIGEQSFVNGDFIPKVYPLTYVKTGNYRLENDINIYGNIGIGISTYDYNGRTGNKFSPYEIKLEVDGKKNFSVKYDKLNYFKNSRIYLSRDYMRIREGDIYYHKLYKELGNDLNIYSPNKIYSGVIFAREILNNGIGGGVHKFKIYISDFKGNTTVVEGNIKVEDGNESVQKVFSNSVNDQLSEFDENIEITEKLYDSFLRLEISGFSENSEFPRIIINDNETVPLYKVSDNILAAKIDFIDDREQINIKIIQGEKIIKKIEYDLIKVSIFGSKITSDDECLCLDIDKGSVYKSFWIKIDTVNIEEKRDLRVSKVYRISPLAIPLKDKIKVKIKYDRSVQNPAKLGIYYFDKEKGKWKYSSVGVDTLKRYVEGEIFEFSEIAILKDLDPPEIYDIYPKNGQKMYNQNPLLKATIEDKLSGIGYDCKTEIFLDREYVVAEFDPEADKLFYRVEKRLAPGKHTVKFVVEDNIGNIAEKNIDFEVVDK